MFFFRSLFRILKDKSSRRSEVRELLRALAAKIEACRAVMKPQEIGNALYGLQAGLL